MLWYVNYLESYSIYCCRLQMKIQMTQYRLKCWKKSFYKSKKKNVFIIHFLSVIECDQNLRSNLQHQLLVQILCNVQNLQTYLNTNFNVIWWFLISKCTFGLLYLNTIQNILLISFQICWPWKSSPFVNAWHCFYVNE